MPAIHVYSRSINTPSESDSLSISSPIYVAGIIVAAVLAFSVALWLTVRFYRRRAAAKREAQMGAAFLSVRGLVREDAYVAEKDPFACTPINASFSRTNLDSTIVLPEKSLSRPSQSRDEIIKFHRESGTFPSPFTAKPFSFAVQGEPNNGSNGAPTLLLPEIPRSRHSMLSIISTSQNRLSVISSLSSSTSTTTLAANGTVRKVRQLFDPVLPDELLVSNGDHLTVMQSFDDGWCVVGRENATFVHQAKSLFKTSPTIPTPAVDGNNVELGVVPAWCFLKPVKGLRAERPMRCSSLGITVKLDSPAGSASRNDLISWANF